MTVDVVVRCRCGAEIGHVEAGALHARRLRDGLVPLARDRSRGAGDLTEDDMSAAARGDLAPPIEFDVLGLVSPVAALPTTFQIWCEKCGIVDLHGTTVRRMTTKAINTKKPGIIRIGSVSR